ncbi:MAG: MFS transporter, partial [Candidatus Heimdallarchaeota archaeon]
MLLQFMMYLCTGILPVNIGNLLTYLPKTTKFGIGVATAGTLIMGIISILTFGYYCDKISEKFSRKKIFIYTNFIWILAFGLSSLAPNYFFYLGFVITSAIGTGAFLPIGYSMIGDLFSPDVRGRKYGVMQFSLVLGVGMGIIFGGLFGRYLGSFGWRYAYGLGFILSSLTLIF